MPTPEDPQAAPPDPSRALLPWLVAVAFFMQALDTTILNTAVPASPALWASRRSA
jgi:hypothetical protein